MGADRSMPETTPPRPERRAPRPPYSPSIPPFRYTAAVFGTGEIREIVESIGKRQVRTIDPGSREGRRLLTSGSVGLWSDGATRAKPRPVGQFLQDLKDEIERQRQRRAGEKDWDRHCRGRLASIERWRTFNAAASEDH